MNSCPKVLPAVTPWLSTFDLDPGKPSFKQIQLALDRSCLGIFCITPENVGEAWINYEMAAISHYGGRPAIPLLFGLKPSELYGPISHFQAVELQPEGIQKICSVIIEVSGKLSSPAEKTLTSRIQQHWSIVQNQLESAEICLPLDKNSKVNLGKVDFEILNEAIEFIYNQRKDVFDEFSGDLVIDSSRPIGDFNDHTPFLFEQIIDTLNLCMRFPNSL